MPGKFVILNIITVLLQYSLLFLLYYFLFKVVKIIYIDLKQANQAINSHVCFADTTADHAKLFLVSKTNINLSQTIFDLKEVNSIGRKDSNDIIIDESFVSNEHACIEKYKDGYWLTDLNSTNGTYVNDCRVIKEVLLKNKDLIRIGAASFRFER